ncbi:MAG: hypothetical protein HKN76_00565 [Saprospiraceae bacterium]|nr:hypothetical protein [Saprospiraceae bacterium]
MYKQPNSLRQNIAKLLNGDRQILEQFYIDMYKEYSGQIRDRLKDIGRADQFFQEAFVLWKSKLTAGQKVMLEMKEADLKISIQDLFSKIVHDKMLDVRVSALYLIEHIRNDDNRAKERLSRTLCNEQNLNYARHLIRSLKIQLLEGEDFLQESIIALMTAIEKGRFTLEANSPNEAEVRKLFKYFREIIYRQIHKAYHKGKPVTQLKDDVKKMLPGEYIESGVEKLELAIYQSFHCLDKISQKMMQYLMVDRLSPKEVVKKLNHAAFAETNDVVAHKNTCLQKLRKLTAEKISEMDQGSFDRYLDVCKNALRTLSEPCKTILVHFLPPLQKSYQEILQVVESRGIVERKYLRTEDQIKKRKYKCMQLLQDQIWQKLLKEIN